MPAGVPWPSEEDAMDAISVQIDAMYRGSFVASATARKAAIGARSCTRIATNTIGKNASSRRRMIFPKSVPSSLTPTAQLVDIFECLVRHAPASAPMHGHRFADRDALLTNPAAE